MRAALDIHRDLLSRDVPHEVIRLPVAALTADDLPRALDLEPTSCVAVRCYVTDRGFAAVAVHAGVVPDPAAVLTALDATTLRAATADEISSETDFAAGLVSPLSLPPGLVLLADAALSTRDVLYCPAGENGLAFGIRSGELLTASGARVVSLTALPLPRQPGDVTLPPAATPAPPSRGRGGRVLDLRRFATRRGLRRPGR